MLGTTVTVTVERPRGSYHPEHPALYYPIHYGYVEGLMGGDGEALDAYILGVDTPVSEFTGQVIAIIHRLDDKEDKPVVAPRGQRFTREEIVAATHFQERYFKIEVEM